MDTKSVLEVASIATEITSKIDLKDFLSTFTPSNDGREDGKLFENVIIDKFNNSYGGSFLIKQQDRSWCDCKTIWGHPVNIKTTKDITSNQYDNMSARVAVPYVMTGKYLSSGSLEKKFFENSSEIKYNLENEYMFIVLDKKSGHLLFSGTRNFIEGDIKSNGSNMPFQINWKYIYERKEYKPYNNNKLLLNTWAESAEKAAKPAYYLNKIKDSIIEY